MTPPTPAPPTQATRVVEVLTRARELLTPEGAWTQQQWGGQNGAQDCYCLAGAIGVAAGIGIYVERVEFFRPFRLALGIRKGPGQDDEDALTNWNDKKGRTQADVLGRLDRGRRAIAAARAAGGGA